MLKIKQIGFLSILLAVFLLSGCSKNIQPGRYDATEIGKVKKVVSGVIISKRPINIYTNQTNIASIDSPAIDGTKRQRGYEYVIKLNNGDIVSIAQDEDLKLKVKQSILVIYGDNTRIVADEGDHE